MILQLEAADVALVSDDSENTLSDEIGTENNENHKANVVFSMGLNFAAIILAITGVLNPVVGALVHNAGSVAVIINSALCEPKDE